MSVFDDAIFDKLNGSQNLKDRMADNVIDANNVPFYADPPKVPAEQDTPYGFVSAPLSNQSDSDASSKQTTGIDQSRAIRIYDDVQQSQNRIDDIGMEIFNLFHDDLLNVDGWSTVFTHADMPTAAPTSKDDLRGRIVNINLTTTRSE